MAPPQPNSPSRQHAGSHSDYSFSYTPPRHPPESIFISRSLSARLSAHSLVVRHARVLGEHLASIWRAFGEHLARPWRDLGETLARPWRDLGGANPFNLKTL